MSEKDLVDLPFLLKKRGWPLSFVVLRNPPILFSSILCALSGLLILAVLCLILISIMRMGYALSSGTPNEASEASKALLPVAAALIGLPLIIWRLVILNQQTRISEIKTEIDRDIQFTSIFSTSVDQMGSMREIKYVSDTTTGNEQFSKTVPNIENRLGGIHALIRLSNDSKKDIKIVQSMLSTYVSENSWSDRDGTQYHNKPNAPDLDHFSWRFDLVKQISIQEAIEKYNLWVRKFDEFGDISKSWAAGINNTRPDVNEALRKLPSLSVKSRENLIILRESLLIDRTMNFIDEINYRFEKCFFINSRIDLNRCNFLQFRDCTLINCDIKGNVGLLNFIRCYVIDCKFDNVEFSILEIYSTNLHECNFAGICKKTLEITFSAFHETEFKIEGVARFKFDFSVFSKSHFVNLKANPESSFERSAFVHSNFKACNFSNVKVLDDSDFSTSETSDECQLPTQIKNQNKWNQQR